MFLWFFFCVYNTYINDNSDYFKTISVAFLLVCLKNRIFVSDFTYNGCTEKSTTSEVYSSCFWRTFTDTRVCQYRRSNLKFFFLGRLFTQSFSSRCSSGTKAWITHGPRRFRGHTTHGPPSESSCRWWNCCARIRPNISRLFSCSLFVRFCVPHTHHHTRTLPWPMRRWSHRIDRNRSFSARLTHY